jgi:cysteine synthase A
MGRDETMQSKRTKPYTTPKLVQQLRSLQRLLQPTPIVQLARDDMDLYAKLEYESFAGSLKDKPALWILKRAAERGDIDAESVIVESSSGNFACALAVLCRLVNLSFVPVIDPVTSSLSESLLDTLCPRVVKVSEPDDTGGFLKTRIRKVQEICHDGQNMYWTNQYENGDGPAAHYLFTAADICCRLSSLDYVFVAVSSAGTIAGVSQRLKEHFPGVQVVAVDAAGSAIFGQAPRRRHIPGYGAAIVPPLLKTALIDDVVHVDERDVILGCRELLSRYGIMAGGSSGAAYAAIKRYLARDRTRVRPRALFLCPDHGRSYLNNIYRDEWTARFLHSCSDSGGVPEERGQRKNDTRAAL